MAEIRFNEEKFRELLLYVAAQCACLPKFGKTKLNKILFFSDFLAFGKLGHPITGATYRRDTYGPVPKQGPTVMADLAKNREADFEYRGFGPRRQHRLVVLREPNLESFTGEEIAIVHAVIAGLEDHTAKEASLLSHHRERGWQIAANGEDIPYSTVFVSTEPPSVDDVKWARDFAAQHGWTA